MRGGAAPGAAARARRGGARGAADLADRGAAAAIVPRIDTRFMDMSI
jgi:hypothetical protein